MLQWANLTADGQIELGRKHKDGDLTILLNGDFGGGTLRFGYKDQDNTYRDFAEGASLTAATEASLAMANGVVLMAELTGSTSPDLNIGIGADFFTASF